MTPDLNGWTTTVDPHTKEKDTFHRTTWARNMREHRIAKRKQAEDRNETANPKDKKQTIPTDAQKLA